MFRLLLLEVKQGNVGGSHVICRNKLCNRKLTPADALSYLGLNPLLSIMLVADFFFKKREGAYLDLITLCRRIGGFRRFLAGHGADGGSGPVRMPPPVQFRRKTYFRPNDEEMIRFGKFLSLYFSNPTTPVRCRTGHLLPSAACNDHHSL